LNCQLLQQGLAEREIDALIAPPLYWGISKDLENYPGTFSVRPETMKALLVDTLMSLRSWGVEYVFVQNAHGDKIHLQMIREAIQEVNKLGGTKVFFMWDLEVEPEHNYKFPEERKGRYQPDYHAGSIETAQMAVFFPEKVKKDVAEKLQPHDSFHPSAYVGDPASYKLDMEAGIEFTRADVAVDVLKIETLLK
ncbi:MAG TPA: creatininase family protein, partial [Clostridia bacterium]